MQLGYMPEKRTIHAAHIWRRLQVENHAKRKGSLRFVDLEKNLGRIPRKVMGNEELRNNRHFG